MSSFQVEMRWRCATCETEMQGRHKKCSGCGKPKEREEFYDAPGVVTRAEAILDAALLKQAAAGKDWECVYCGSHERRDSGECRNCGSATEDSVPPTVRTGSAPPATPTRGRSVLSRSNAPWFLSFVGAALVSFLLWFALSPKEVTARVAERQWMHTVHVERYQVVADEGFHEAQPVDAFDVEHAGSRVHHHDRVPDGFRTESYQESYSCGETCYTTPVNCTSNQNGFKTCSGGSRSCSPKYCSRTAYRQVPKFRDVPVYRPWYQWSAWRWRHNRDVTESGSGAKVRWPSAQRLALGQRERANRDAKYSVAFRDEDGERHEYAPKTLGEFQGLGEGQSQRLRVGALGGVEIVRGAP